MSKRIKQIYNHMMSTVRYKNIGVTRILMKKEQIQTKEAIASEDLPPILVYAQ